MQLAAPWYVHPAEDPDAWERLSSGTDLAFAVVNAASGPNLSDPYYQPVLAGNFFTQLLGYVNVDYGQRPRREVLTDVETWLQIPSVTGIMFDCVPTQKQQKHWNLEVIDEARKAGASLVATNPGTPPDPELVLKSDVTCVGEFDWATFQTWEKPEYLNLLPSDRQWLLVYDVPEADQDQALARIASQNVTYGWVTAGALPNPWAHLPKRW